MRSQSSVSTVDVQLLTILNLNHVAVLFVRRTGLGSDKVTLVVACLNLIALFVFFVRHRISRAALIFLTFAFLYIGMKSIQGILLDSGFAAVLSTAVGWSSFFIVYAVLTHDAPDVIIDIVRRVALTSVKVLIVIDLATHFFRGNGIPTLLQNDVYIYVMVFTMLILFFNVELTKEEVRWMTFFVFWALLSPFIFGSRVQTKAVLMLAMILVLSVTMRALLSLKKSPVVLLFAKYLLVSLVLAAIVFSSGFTVVTDLASMVGRAGSVMLRFRVSEQMINEVVSGTKSLITWGYGFGSSNRTFQFTDATNNIWEMSPHSGLISFFYENGLFGLVVTLLLIILIPILKVGAFPLKSESKSVIGKNIVQQLLWTSFVIFILSINLVYYQSMPSGSPYFQGSLIITASFLSLLARPSSLPTDLQKSYRPKRKMTSS
jgi:hypothetical protein